MRRNRSGRSKRNQRSSKISEHFSRRDFVCKCGTCKESIRLSLGLVGGLELLRNMAQNRINILKGYICPEEAEKTNSLKRNYHTQGIAAEITVDTKDIRDVFLLAEQIPEFMGIGLDLTKQCIHVDTRKAEKRELWVMDGITQIELTADNRSKYFDGHGNA